MRERSRLITEPQPPPPSPIPTGRGSRSASNEPFNKFLDGSLQVPALSLPETSVTRRSVPAAVDLRSLVSGAGDSVDRILRSAKDFGAFRIVGHGISVDELRSLIGEIENERVLGRSERESGLGDRILWIGSRKEGLESERRVIGDERYRYLSVNTRNVTSKLEAIAEQLNQILIKNSVEKSGQKRIFEGKDSVLSLYKYNNNHQSFLEQNQSPPTYEKESKLCDQYSLSLHLPFEHCQIYVQSEMQLLPFEAGPDTLVVTIGKQLEEWSMQEFKYFSGKMMFVQTDHSREIRDNYSFSLELRFSSSNSKTVLDRNYKTISILDQIVIAITITLLYKVFMFFTSQIAGA